MRVHIRLGQTLGPCLARLFEDMEVRTETVVSGELPDRAALYRALARRPDLDLAMAGVSVEVTEPARLPSAQRQMQDDVENAAASLKVAAQRTPLQMQLILRFLPRLPVRPTRQMIRTW